MTYIDDITNEINIATPKYGYNVCLYDDYEYVGEKLTVLEHFGTIEEAEEFAGEMDGEIYIYGDDGQADESQSVAKNHNIDVYLDMALDDYLSGVNRPNEEFERKNYGEAVGLSRDWDEDEKGKSGRPMGHQMPDNDTGFFSAQDEDLESARDRMNYEIDNPIAGGHSWQIGGENDDHECRKDEDGNCLCETCDTDSNQYNNMSCKICKRSKGFESYAEEYSPVRCYGCAGTGRFLDGSTCPICGGLGKVDDDIKTHGVEARYACKDCNRTFRDIYAWEEHGEYHNVKLNSNEGGKGSGRSGHKKWMLGAEVGEECSNCMMITETKDGICTVCGI